MKGSHHIVLETKRIKYEFTIKRNITIIKGDSATGKTTLIELLAEYGQYGANTGIMLQSDVRCVVFRPSQSFWIQELQLIENSIVFIDEGYSFIYAQDFAAIIKDSSNYYVIVTREPLHELPYSINEIYGIRSSGRFHYPEKIYHEFYPIYDAYASSMSSRKGYAIAILS